MSTKSIKNQRKGTRGRRADIVPPELQAFIDRVPLEFRPLINGTTINLSGASAFYKKKAATAEVLKDFVEALPDTHYLLKNGFGPWFLASLPGYGQRSWQKPPESLADALVYLGIYWARIKYGHLPERTEAYKQFLGDPWSGADGDLTDLLKSRSLSMLTMLCAVQDDNTLVDANWREPILRPLELSLEFATSLKEPPGMTIKVRGKPAARFMSWWGLVDRLGLERARQEQGELCDSVATLLRSILQTVETTMGLRRSRRGRPNKALAERAAYAIEHDGKSIRIATRELCEARKEPGHKCNEQYYDRIRKAARSYYKQQARQIQSLIRVNTERMS